MPALLQNSAEVSMIRMSELSKAPAGESLTLRQLAPRLKGTGWFSQPDQRLAGKGLTQARAEERRRIRYDPSLRTACAWPPCSRPLAQPRAPLRKQRWFSRRARL